MKLSRFSYIPQPVIPNQRNDERIFVFCRRHPVDFLPTIIIILFLLILPIIFISAIWSEPPTSSMLDPLYVRDMIVLATLIYILILETVTITSWVNYYYNVLIVSDERIVEIAQKGLFSREIKELVFEQIEDVTSKTNGFLNTIFEAGELEIQTAGTQSNFHVSRIPRSDLIVEIIQELSHQAKKKILTENRIPDLATIGVINGRLVSRDGKKPAIMNFDQSMKETFKRFQYTLENPKNLREKLDYWWQSHHNQMTATFGARFSEPIQTKIKTDEKKSDSDMVDL